MIISHWIWLISGSIDRVDGEGGRGS